MKRSGMSPGPQRTVLGIDPVERVFVMENHDEAYHIWRRANVKDRILVHIDAHHDMWWIPDDAPVTTAIPGPSPAVLTAPPYAKALIRLRTRIRMTLRRRCTRGECDARTQGALICRHMSATEDDAACRPACTGGTRLHFDSSS